jgi:diacylglycerol O-acyltransferase
MSEFLSPVDAAWFRMDTRVNTADIVALITFAGEVEPENVEDVVTRKFGTFRQFTHRVRDPGAGLPHWEEMPDFAITDNIHRHRLQAGTREELQEFVSGVLTRDLAHDRPLWELHIIQNVVGGSAVVAKIHHALGDGFALVGVLLSLADGAPEPPKSAMDDVVVSGGLLHGLRDLVANPDEAVQLARTAGRAATTLGELLLMPFDRETGLRTELTGIRKAAWSHGIDLEHFKAVASATGGTINDVLLTILAGAVRHWLADRGVQVDDGEIRAMVPVNLRPIEDLGKELGNRFGLVFFDMPIDRATIDDRAEAVRAAMNKLKASPQAVVALGVLASVGVLPEVVEHLATDVFAKKASMVVTNVPGPRSRLRLAGMEVDHVMFWVPHPATLGLGVSLLSYAGEVRIGVRADTAVATEPAELITWFERELRAYREALGL